MNNTRGKPLPRWVVLLGSIAIAVHLLLLLLLVVAAPSGPWPTPFGTASTAEPPQFAGWMMGNWKMQNYFRLVQMTSNYHFSENQTDLPTVFFEVRFKDKDGKEIEALKFPQDNVNRWVRQRQAMLAQSLANDQPVQAPRTISIPAPGDKSKVVNIWSGEKVMKLESVAEYALPKDRPVWRPSKWSFLLAESYVRYVTRTLAGKYQDAAKVEFIRHSRNPVAPESLIAGRLLGADEMICSFGEYPIEK